MATNNFMEIENCNKNFTVIQNFIISPESELLAMEQIVYIHLLKYSNLKNITMSIEKLSTELYLSRVTVHKILKCLKEKKFITVINRYNKITKSKDTNIYMINDLGTLPSYLRYLQSCDNGPKKNIEIEKVVDKVKQKEEINYQLESFERFYLGYPEKIGSVQEKENTFIHWKKLIKSGVAAPTILSGLKGYQIFLMTKTKDYIKFKITNFLYHKEYLNFVEIKPPAINNKVEQPISQRRKFE